MKRLTFRVLLPLIALLVLMASPAHAAGWFACGDISKIGWSCQLSSYPSSQYEYGIAYNTREPSLIACSYWNYGMRIYNRLPYFVMSDDPSSSVRWGGFMFYTGTLATDDDTCGSWRHRYWQMDQNNVVTTHSSNGCYGANLTIYCRSR